MNQTSAWQTPGIRVLRTAAQSASGGNLTNRAESTTQTPESFVPSGAT